MEDEGAKAQTNKPLEVTLNTEAEAAGVPMTSARPEKLAVVPFMVQAEVEAAEKEMGMVTAA